MKARFVGVALVVGACSLLTRSVVFAQDAAPREDAVPTAPSAPASPPLDVVMTHDGGMVRGTIIESVPGQYAVITLPTGETRRFDGAQIRYAGPRSGAPTSTLSSPGAPPAPSPPSTAEAADTSAIELRLGSPQPGVTFHRVRLTSTAEVTASGFSQGRVVSMAGTARGHTFERLCTAPCQVELPRGEYELALSAGGDPIPAAEIVRLDAATAVSGVYTDNSGLRAAGWVSIIGGGLAGVAIVLVPILTGTDIANDSAGFWAPFGVGLGVIAVTSIIGWVLTSQQDGATIRFD